MLESQSPAASRESRLDDLDRAILQALYTDASTTNKALARRLGIAESTCAYRIRALRESGAIRGTYADLDLDALGFPLQAIIKVRLGSHDRDRVNQLYEGVIAAPGVIRAYHVAGSDDFHLHVAVENAQALRDLVLSHVTNHQVVRGTETQLVFELRAGVGVLSGSSTFRVDDR